MTYKQTVVSRQWTFGIPDDEFHQRKPLRGLITKSEVRVIALSKMRIRPDSIVWDIGAGSGSISIEAALIAGEGSVHAIEKNLEDCEIAQKNIQKFGTANVQLLHGTAPDFLESFPDPDAVFVGGSAGKMSEIIDIACRRLRPGGRIVVDAATIENLSEAAACLKNNGLLVDITMVSVSRSKDIIGLTRFEAMNPVFVITGRRKMDGDAVESRQEVVDD